MSQVCALLAIVWIGVSLGAFSYHHKYLAVASAALAVFLVYASYVGK